MRLQNMDTSSPAVFVNGELLCMFIERKVHIVVQVMQSDAGSIIGKSTDNQQVIIKNSQPTQPLTTYVEAIGIADSNQSVRAEILTNFGDNFGMQIQFSVLSCQPIRQTKYIFHWLLYT